MKASCTYGIMATGVIKTRSIPFAFLKNLFRSDDGFFVPIDTATSKDTSFCTCFVEVMTA
jgi:hypothetical protein